MCGAMVSGSNSALSYLLVLQLGVGPKMFSTLFTKILGVLDLFWRYPIKKYGLYYITNITALPSSFMFTLHIFFKFSPMFFNAIVI